MDDAWGGVEVFPRRGCERRDREGTHLGRQTSGGGLDHKKSWDLWEGGWSYSGYQEALSLRSREVDLRQDGYQGALQETDFRQEGYQEEPRFRDREHYAVL